MKGSVGGMLKNQGVGPGEIGEIDRSNGIGDCRTPSGCIKYSHIFNGNPVRSVDNNDLLGFQRTEQKQGTYQEAYAIGHVLKNHTKTCKNYTIVSLSGFILF